MPFRRVLNSIALINGSWDSEVLIKQIYSTVPELTKIFSKLYGRLADLNDMFWKASIPRVSIEKAKFMGNGWNPL
jgi:hypothetical protein